MQPGAYTVDVIDASTPSSSAEDNNALPEALLVLLAVLAASFAAGRLAEKTGFVYIGAAGCALIIGLLVGCAVHYGGLADSFTTALAFQGNIFLYGLLPIIIFEAGYDIDAKAFVNNLGTISCTAFAGTTISTFLVGLLMWAFGQAGWCYQMPFLFNLAFGAVISATDPVTVLAVFQTLKADGDLFVNVFGESVLNDAVALVLYDTIKAFLPVPGTVPKDVNAIEVWRAIGSFVGIFLGSVVMGVAVGVLCSVLYRSRFLYSQGSMYETGTIVVFAYASFFVAQVSHLSGIVSVLFCSMVMSAYTRPNLSHEGTHLVHGMLKVLAGLFDQFLFCYIGLTLFLQEESGEVWSFAALCLLALGVSRLANIVPCVGIPNWLRPAHRRVSVAMQFVMWWSGLRGAMAFAIAVLAAEEFGDYGKAMKTTTFYMIFLTVVVNGGLTGKLLEKLQLREEDTVRRRLKQGADAAASVAAAATAPVPLTAQAEGPGSSAQAGAAAGHGPPAGGRAADGRAPAGPMGPEAKAAHVERVQGARTQSGRPGKRRAALPVRWLRWLRRHNDGQLWEWLVRLDHRYFSKWLVAPPLPDSARCSYAGDTQAHPHADGDLHGARSLAHQPSHPRHPSHGSAVPHAAAPWVAEVRTMLGQELKVDVDTELEAARLQLVQAAAAEEAEDGQVSGSMGLHGSSSSGTTQAHEPGEQGEGSNHNAGAPPGTSNTLYHP